MAESVRIAVFGAAGKMGCLIVRAIAETPGACLVAAVERADFPELGSDASQRAGLPESGVRLQADRPARGAADVWIDFSAPGLPQPPGAWRKTGPFAKRRGKFPQTSFPNLKSSISAGSW